MGPCNTLASLLDEGAALRVACPTPTLALLLSLTQPLFATTPLL